MTYHHLYLHPHFSSKFWMSIPTAYSLFSIGCCQVNSSSFTRPTLNSWSSLSQVRSIHSLPVSINGNFSLPVAPNTLEWCSALLVSSCPLHEQVLSLVSAPWDKSRPPLTGVTQEASVLVCSMLALHSLFLSVSNGSLFTQSKSRSPYTGLQTLRGHLLRPNWLRIKRLIILDDVNDSLSYTLLKKRNLLICINI